MANYIQRRFTPQNPEKYAGDPTTIMSRSSWEYKVMLFLDRHKDVLTWSSEEKVIPYMSPVDKQIHRYYPDFLAQFRQRDGSIKNVMIEVKPSKQTVAPQKPKRMTRRFIQEVQTYAVNEAKWKAATHWCKQNGFEFQLITEKELNV